MEPTTNDLLKDQPEAPRNRLKLAVLISMGLTLGLLLGWLTFLLINSNLLTGSPKFHGVVLPEPDKAPGFTLTAHTGEEADLTDFEGQLVLIYFGYTYCPDVCPATLAELSRALKLLDQKDREEVQVLMISVDPGRDTPEVLADYMAHFDPSFLGLTGSDSEVAAAAHDYGIFVQKQEGTVESGYLVNHTANVAVVDQDGYLRLIFKFNTPAEDITADLESLLDG
jgi:protein SCO1/2